MRRERKWLSRRNPLYGRNLRSPTNLVKLACGYLLTGACFLIAVADGSQHDYGGVAFGICSGLFFGFGCVLLTLAAIPQPVRRRSPASPRLEDDDEILTQKLVDRSPDIPVVASVDKQYTTAPAGPKIRADLVPVHDLLSPSSIQSKTWIFASAAERHRFDEAVARLPDLARAAQERGARPLQGEFLEAAMDLPGRTLLGVFAVWSTRHVRSTTRNSRRFGGDYGQLVLACALAMSAAKHPIITLTDTPAGARIVSYLPMNGATYAGTLCLDLRAEDGGLVTVDARATFIGQLFDWFRGRRELHRVWQDIHTYLTAMGAHSALEPGA